MCQNFCLWYIIIYHNNKIIKWIIKYLLKEEKNMEENIITLIDEDGKEVEFEVCLTLEAQGKDYAILLPIDDSDYD